MKTFCALGWLVALVLSVCLWQEYHNDKLAKFVDCSGIAYPVYINRDTPETTHRLKVCEKDLDVEMTDVKFCIEKLKKMELP